MARSAAVIVPAPEHAPRTMTGFIFNTYRPNKIATVCGRTAITRPTRTRLIPDFCNPEKKLGPAARPTQAMKTVNPTVSKTHMAEGRAHLDWRAVALTARPDLFGGQGVHYLSF